MSVGGNISAVTLGGNLNVAIWGQTADGNSELWGDLWTRGAPGESSGWSGWFPLNYEEIDLPSPGLVTISGPPCVVSGVGPNQLDFFATDSPGDLWHVWNLNGAWGNWKCLGAPSAQGLAAATLSAVSRKLGMLDVFGVADSALWHRARLPKGWEKWENLAGPAGYSGPPYSLQGGLASAPCAVSCNPERMDVVAVGNDYNLWQTTWPSGPKGLWQPWICLLDVEQGNLLSIDTSGPPAVAAVGENQIAAFLMGQDGSLWYVLSAELPSNNAGFDQLLPYGSLGSPVVAVTGGPEGNLVDLFATSPNLQGAPSSLIHIPVNWDQPGSSLKIYTAIPDTIPSTFPALRMSPPCPVTEGPNLYDVLAVDQQGWVEHFSMNLTGQWEYETLKGELVH